MIMKVVVIFISLLLPSFILSSEHNLTIDEDFEIEKLLKLLNKPAIKTIVENGDIFDCVDINKQPAFDHPSLKGHQIQLRPSSLPVGLCDNDKIKSSSGINSMEIGLQESCPSGTVPIKRLQKEDLIGMRSSFKQYKIRPSSSNVNDDASNQRWATMHTPLRPEYQHWYFGASGYVGVYGFSEMLETQGSSSVFWIANDDDINKSNNIVVGWRVHPTNNGDKNTRLVAGFWTYATRLEGLAAALSQLVTTMSAFPPMGSGHFSREKKVMENHMPISTEGEMRDISLQSNDPIII
ncbi:uncharacterized protein LOC120280499 [Dioscorea cayenensis subsp. rotundata]|uniref:Uncharacterized protein LOC120280499 n=1 Tax=Dioscorea cayennensis subsp. rotundata TaxID=55577 RepID=A0AB40CXW3_DIOCR|nr:uncharacterized protein LOC120280499 [Dioscorea cayenensis subsp. rotundata]